MFKFYFLPSLPHFSAHFLYFFILLGVFLYFNDNALFFIKFHITPLPSLFGKTAVPLLPAGDRGGGHPPSGAVPRLCPIRQV